MSQVKFKTSYNNIPVEVVGGWDSPLQYYHFTIYDLRPEAEEECIYSCLDVPGVFQIKNLDKWKEVLNSMNIIPPDEFWDRCNLKEGNCIHKFENGKWSS